MENIKANIEPGYCQCGCGQKTNLIKYDWAPQGKIKGQPYLFVRGHHRKRGKQEKVIRRGYVLLQDSHHPRANRIGRVREHIVIAERVLGKPLPPGAVVHHVDENPINNRKDNLLICDQSYHNLIHARMRALKACGNLNFRKCKICHRWDDPNNMGLDIKNHSVFHKKCRQDKSHHDWLIRKKRLQA